MKRKGPRLPLGEQTTGGLSNTHKKRETETRTHPARVSEDAQYVKSLTPTPPPTRLGLRHRARP